jgi:hypothetical protein
MLREQFRNMKNRDWLRDAGVPVNTIKFNWVGVAEILGIENLLITEYIWRIIFQLMRDMIDLAIIVIYVL